MHSPNRRSLFGDFQGSQTECGGDGLEADPPGGQALLAGQAQRHEGSKPHDRDWRSRARGNTQEPDDAICRQALQKSVHFDPEMKYVDI